MPRDPTLMFHELARYYDLLAAHKDYPAESRALQQLARRYGRSGGRTWLDVACGTGRHLEHLRKRYSVTGVDLSPEMLRIARRRLPGIRLYRADMRTFDLGRQFDVVSCLFSAIGHLSSEGQLVRAFTNFARHLKPGGVAIVEPWISPEMFRAGSVHLTQAVGPGLLVARLAYSRRRGHRSAVQYHYLIGTENRGVRYAQETSPGLLVSPGRLVRLMRESGLRVRFLRRGLTPGRGLLVGVRP